MNPDEFRKAIDLFLAQHATVHASEVAACGLYSFDDELWQGLSEEAARCIPKNGEHSIAWMIWHIARIEDVTMSLLVAGGRQAFSGDDWPVRMNATVRETGNALDEAGITALSTGLAIEGLRAYRTAVGKRTRIIAGELTFEDVKRKIDATRLERVRDEGAVPEAADWLLRYWGSLTVAGLLLMPPTRHNFVHLNEALRLKPKVNNKQ